MLQLPNTQLVIRPGIIEFGWGHPHPGLLPIEELAAAAAALFASQASDALAYGAAQGPGQLIEQIGAYLSRLDGVAPDPARLMITGGVSQALDMLCTLLVEPGDVALVEAPSYHLAQRILRDHRIELLPVPGDSQGMRIEAIEGLLELVRSQGRRVRLLYTVPTFNNPSGLTLALERRIALAELAQRAGFYVLEDDVYRELWYDAPPPPPIALVGPDAPVIRLCSFSKILAPGLRLGWMVAPPEVVERCTGCGLLDSGGGVSHFTAHLIAEFMARGLLSSQVARLRPVLRNRRDTLLAALARELPAGCTWRPPLGGYFIWVRLPAHIDSAALLPAAEAAGVAFLPGARFAGGSEGNRHLRLAFSLLSLEELNEGARRLGAVLRDH